MPDMDINQMLDNLLSDPDMGEKISQAVSMLTGGGQQSAAAAPESGGGAEAAATAASENHPGAAKKASTGQGGGFPDMEMLMKLKGVFDQLQNSDDPRVNLLNALRPYLSEKRSDKLEKTIKLLKLASIGTMAKDMNLFKDLL